MCKSSLTDYVNTNWNNPMLWTSGYIYLCNPFIKNVNLCKCMQLHLPLYNNDLPICQGWHLEANICSSIHPFVCSIIHLFIHSFIHSFVVLFRCSFINSFIHVVQCPRLGSNQRTLHYWLCALPTKLSNHYIHLGITIYLYMINTKFSLAVFQ